MLSKFALLVFLSQNVEQAKKLFELAEKFEKLFENGVTQVALEGSCDLVAEAALIIKPIIGSFPTGVFAMSVDDEEERFTSIAAATGIDRPRLKKLFELFLEHVLPRLVK